MVAALRTYRIQRDRVYGKPFAGLGRNLGIIHLSMLYWPESEGHRVITWSRKAIPLTQETPPSVRAGERSHGEHLDRGGIKVTGI